jgi:hypothetical protein
MNEETLAHWGLSRQKQQQLVFLPCSTFLKLCSGINHTSRLTFISGCNFDPDVLFRPLT